MRDREKRVGDIAKCDVAREESRPSGHDVRFEPRSADHVAVNTREREQVVSDLHEGRAFDLVDDDGCVLLNTPIRVGRTNDDELTLGITRRLGERAIPGALMTARGTGFTRGTRNGLLHGVS